MDPCRNPLVTVTTNSFFGAAMIPVVMLSIAAMPSRRNIMLFIIFFIFNS